ncbi:hypothetical protein AVEN_267627-1 [Araneus ventricosus]|uniref:Uncharacterized protein n=1 Tax=Araneus ventricosus TaxID=182803 RepID=A0A4Y2Q1D8_ARAVE|nr:hypothetical protein AVEN_267627-1 [Araneus ventricosus]
MTRGRPTRWRLLLVSPSFIHFAWILTTADREQPTSRAVSVILVPSRQAITTCPLSDSLRSTAFPITRKKERARLRVVKEENRRIKYVSASKSSASYEPLQENSSSNSSENIDSEDFPTLIESSEPGTNKSVIRKDFISPKLVAALDRCQLSRGDSVFVLEATIDALGCNIDAFPISKSSIQRIRTEKRKERAENIKIDFQNEVPDVVTLHWDGKLLPALGARKSKEELLSIVISYGLKKQCIAVPRLDNSTGKEQAQAVWKAILD